MHTLRPFILVLLIVPSIVMANAPVEENCEQQNPLRENPLEGIAPNCLIERVIPNNPRELIENDGRVCDCLANNPLMAQTTYDASAISSRNPDYMGILAYATVNNLALQILTQSTDARSAEARLLTQTGQEIRASLPSGYLVPTVSQLVTEANQISPENSQSQCVTFLEYSYQRTFPYENEFFTSLQSASAFNAREWNLQALSETYSASPQSERPGIRARMKFLARNPALRSLLEANSVEGIGSEVLQQRQIELFNMIKSLSPSPDSSCRQRTNGCWQEVHTSGAMTNFRTRLNDFMTRSDVTDIVSKQTTNTFIDSFSYARDESFNRGIGARQSSSPESYFNFLRVRLPLVSQGCAGPQTATLCYQLFNFHCARLSELRARISNNVVVDDGETLLRELLDEEVFHGSQSPDSNTNFNAFNEIMCTRPYKNENGESLNFFQFRERHCAGRGSRRPECSDRRQLLNVFFLAYNIGDDPAAARIRSALFNNMANIELASVTSAQITAANSIREAPRSLRERFGGNIPTVSSQGSLIAYTGKPTRISSNSPSSILSSSSSSTGLSSSDAASTSPMNASPQAFNRNESRTDSYQPSSNWKREYAAADAQSAREAEEFENKMASIRENRRRQQTPQNNRQAQSQMNQAPAQAQISQSAPNPPEVPIVSSIGGSSRSPLRSSGGGSSAVSEGGSVGSAGGRGSGAIVEVTPRRSSGSRSGRTPASSENESVREVFDFRPVIPVELNEDTLRNVLTDPQILLGDRSIMEKVNQSPEQVVRLGLRTPGSSEDTVVYAIKESGGVRFSLTAPSESVQNRSSILSSNEMNLRIMDQSAFAELSANPQNLLSNGDLIKAARTLQGNIIQVNLISPTGSATRIFLDKRTSVFSTVDPRTSRSTTP